VYELLEADASGHVDTIVFNGVVDTTDPAVDGASVPAW
jgi:hypothetical protein